MKRAMAQAKSTKRFNTQVKNVMLSMEETKYKTTPYSSLPTSFSNIFHNSVRAVKLWEQGSNGGMVVFPLDQGDDVNQFIGKEYYAKTLKLSMQFTFPYDRLGTTVKLWYVPVKTGQPDPSYTEFFRIVCYSIFFT